MKSFASPSRRNAVSSTFGLGILPILISLVGFVNQGCNTKTPTQSTLVATATPTLAPNIISNLENGSLKLNSVEYPEGVWYASTWGDPGNKVNANWVTCGGVGGNGSDCAIHLFGLLTDNADGQYPSFQLECILGTGYFDASRFTGVRFDYKFGTGDSPVPPSAGESVLLTPLRRFNLVIASIQQDIKGGTCPSNCFDHFCANLSATAGAWVPKSCIFSTMKRAWDGGYPTSLTKLSANELRQVIELQWQVGRNGSKGRYTVDYWVDDVEFF